MHTKNTFKIFYFITGAFLSTVIIILLSNLLWLRTGFGNIPRYSYKSVQPYTSSETQYRFAINDFNQELSYTSLLISAVSNDYSIDIHYQFTESDEYFPVNFRFQSGDEITSTYDLDGTGLVQNLYVDVNGNFTQAPTITVQNKEIRFGITFPAVIFGLTVFMLFAVVYHLRSFFRDIYRNRDILKILVINDLKARYAGSFFGMIWSFAQPALTILVFWFVFQLGFKNPPVQDMPFILWFIPAYIPWMFFQDIALNATGCLREYSYLVKKMKFQVDVLPVIKIISSFIIHLCFILLMFLAYGAYGIKPGWGYLQLLYYSFALAFMSCGLSWLIAALSVFMKDFSQIISIILQLGYFAIPVFWTEDMMAPSILTVLKLNPIYYVVQGYRDCMTGNILFWQYPWHTIYFWIFSIIVFWGGISLFERVKKHFADLL